MSKGLALTEILANRLVSLKKNTANISHTPKYVWRHQPPRDIYALKLTESLTFGIRPNYLVKLHSEFWSYLFVAPPHWTLLSFYPKATLQFKKLERRYFVLFGVTFCPSPVYNLSIAIISDNIEFFNVNLWWVIIVNLFARPEEFWEVDT